MSTGQSWCPFSRNECRDDCAWLVTTYDIDEDGIARYTNCAMSLLACTLCELNENIVEANCINE